MTRWGTQVELELLIRYAREAKRGIVEIGVFDGETTIEFAKVTSVPIWGIDPIVPDSMPPYALGSAENVWRNIAPYPNITFIQDFSYNAVKTFDHKIDVLFIDGDHNFDAVRRDFIEWFEFVTVGGYIILHDTAPVESIQPSPFGGHPGPTDFANILCDNTHGYGKWVEFVERCDTIRVFRKVDSGWNFSVVNLPQ